MPELPEVETIVREVAPRLVGRRIRRAHLAKSDVLRRVSRKRLLAALTGNTVIAATRRAKHAVFQLKSGHRMVIQPRMTGSLIVHEPGWSDEDSGYAVLTCTLTGGDVFVYRDVRRLGTVWLLDDRGWAAYTARIGPEPLERASHHHPFQLQPHQQQPLQAGSGAALLPPARGAAGRHATGRTIRQCLHRPGVPHAGSERAGEQLRLQGAAPRAPRPPSSPRPSPAFRRPGE